MTSNRSSSGHRFVTDAYSRYGEELRRYLSRRLPHDQDVRDLGQEVWTRLLRIRDPNEVLEPLAYIYRTAANVIAEFRMRRGRERVSFDNEATEYFLEHAPDPLHGVDSTQQLERHVQLEQMLAKLPKTYRNILILKITDELSYAQIGEQLGLSAKTVEQYFFRAMALVKRKPA